MPQQPETRLQKKMQVRLKARGAYVFKVHGGIYSEGIPDLIGCYRGFFFALEVKTPQNKKGATKLQQANLRLARKAGGYAYVVRTVEACDKLCDAIDRRLDAAA